MIPTVHLNGTSRAELLQGYMDASEALRLAIAEVQREHARTAGTRGPAAISGALAEHRNRLERLESVMREIKEIAENIC